MAAGNYPSRMIPRDAPGTVAPQLGGRLNRRPPIRIRDLPRQLYQLVGKRSRERLEEQIAAGFSVADLNRVGSFGVMSGQTTRLKKRRRLAARVRIDQSVVVIGTACPSVCVSRAARNGRVAQGCYCSAFMSGFVSS